MQPTATTIRTPLLQIIAAILAIIQTLCNSWTLVDFLLPSYPRLVAFLLLYGGGICLFLIACSHKMTGLQFTSAMIILALFLWTLWKNIHHWPWIGLDISVMLRLGGAFALLMISKINNTKAVFIPIIMIFVGYAAASFNSYLYYTSQGEPYSYLPILAVLAGIIAMLILSVYSGFPTIAPTIAIGLLPLCLLSYDYVRWATYGFPAHINIFEGSLYEFLICGALVIALLNLKEELKEPVEPTARYTETAVRK